MHFIGGLQSNKADDAVKLFDVIHSLDRRSLLEAMIKAAEKADRVPEIYVQVNIGEEEPKGVCPINEVVELVSAVRASPLATPARGRAPPTPAKPFALGRDRGQENNGNRGRTP